MQGENQGYAGPRGQGGMYVGWRPLQGLLDTSDTCCNAPALTPTPGCLSLSSMQQHLPIHEAPCRSPEPSPEPSAAPSPPGRCSSYARSADHLLATDKEAYGDVVPPIKDGSENAIAGPGQYHTSSAGPAAAPIVDVPPPVADSARM